MNSFCNYCAKVLAILILAFAVGTTHAAYCAAYSSYVGCDEYIYGVMVGTINNIGTGCNNYADYTSSYSTVMEIGTGYTIDVITAVDDEPYTGYEGDQCAIWVDWNQDEDFLDAGEAVYSAFDFGFFTTTITPPSGAVLGQTRMRIRLIYTGEGDTMSPCGTALYGEVEDYTIEVGEGGGGYCDTSTTFTFGEYISRVRVGDIDKSSGSTGYSDYTAYSTQMQLGQSYGITVNNGNSYFTDVCGIWVDWNQDSDFTDAGEAISVSGNPGYGPYTATITPPGSAAEGETRMRIRIVDPGQGDTLSPCGPADYGEVEDYTIEVSYPYLPGRITGSKFNDLDGDGNWDAGEDGIQGWEIYLDLNDNGQYEASEPNVVTGLNGFYEFTDLPPDTYSVAEMARAGWQQTFPGGGSTHTFAVEPNEVVEDVNFGNIETGATSISIQAIEDTYADSGSPDTNYGSNESFCSGKISDSVYRTYLKFDLSSIPVGKTIVSARLRLDSGFVSFPYPQIGARYLVNDDWGEMTLTWNNALTEFSPVAADTVTISIGDNFWTVTDDVEAAYWADGIYSVVFVSADEALAAGACFSSEEALVLEWRPYLEIEFENVIEYGGGTGSAEDPYKIWTSEQMNEIGLHTEDWDKHFILMADIDLSAYTGTQFNIIGIISYEPHLEQPFTGVFDGNGYSISNFTYTSSEELSYDVGLFSTITIYDWEQQTSEIKNLTLVDPNINVNSTGSVGALTGGVWMGNLTNCRVIGGSVSGSGSDLWSGVGGLAGYAEGDISNCHSSADVSGHNVVGGLIGGYAGEMFMLRFTMQDCSANASVSGNAVVGGLVGYFVYGTLVNSYSDGVVSATGNMIGGLLGKNGPDYLAVDNYTSNCYSTCSVSGNEMVGGLIGYNTSEVSNCYSAGPVDGTTDVGGFVGASSGGLYSSCFWDSDINSGHTGVGNITDPAEVMGRTMAEMQTESTFTDYGWDFATPIWKICDGAAYPRLWWEARALDGDVNNDCMVDLVDLAIVSYQWQGEPGDPSADIAPPGGDGAVNSDDLLIVAANWLTGAEAPIPGDLTVDLALDNTWMYQNVGSTPYSNLTANASIVDDPYNNSSYTYAWEFILPGDVTVEPSTIGGGEATDASWNFAAPNANEPNGLSDSGQPLTVKVTVTGVDYANTGSAEVQFGIALLADVNNDTAVNVADRSIINAFWRTGAAGNFTLKDCDVNSDGSVSVADRSIANAVWRGLLGQNSVTGPCPLR